MSKLRRKNYPRACHTGMTAKYVGKGGALPYYLFTVEDL
jgi:hypothetical protein